MEHVNGELRMNEKWKKKPLMLSLCMQDLTYTCNVSNFKKVPGNASI